MLHPFLRCFLRTRVICGWKAEPQVLNVTYFLLLSAPPPSVDLETLSLVTDCGHMLSL